MASVAGPDAGEFAEAFGAAAVDDGFHESEARALRGCGGRDFLPAVFGLFGLGGILLTATRFQACLNAALARMPPRTLNRMPKGL
jgi:hypothetical protein